MKTIKFGLDSLTMVGTTFHAIKRSKTEKVKVFGNCRMCKRHIEMAAKSLVGVINAIWDKETEILTVRFNFSKINLDDIELAIAKEGHDTANHKAKIEFYAELPKCCKYHRDVIEKGNM